MHKILHKLAAKYIDEMEVKYPALKEELNTLEEILGHLSKEVEKYKPTDG